MPAPNVLRTLAIVRLLAQGERLTLPDGHILAMTEDMAIGYAVHYGSGEWRLSPLATMDLTALDALLTREGIGHPLPPAPIQDDVSSREGAL